MMTPDKGMTIPHIPHVPSLGHNTCMSFLLASEFPLPSTVMKLYIYTHTGVLDDYDYIFDYNVVVYVIFTIIIYIYTHLIKQPLLVHASQGLSRLISVYR